MRKLERDLQAQLDRYPQGWERLLIYWLWPPALMARVVLAFVRVANWCVESMNRLSGASRDN